MPETHLQIPNSAPPQRLALAAFRSRSVLGICFGFVCDQVFCASNNNISDKLSALKAVNKSVGRNMAGLSGFEPGLCAVAYIYYIYHSSYFAVTSSLSPFNCQSINQF